MADKRYHILYVDDEENNLIVFKNAFFREYQVHTALSAQEGLSILDQNMIHLIITDQKMPGMTGVEFLEKVVKTHPETGRKNLLIGRHAYDIVGLSAAESEALLQELVEFACQAPRVYHHDWQAGDAVIWDNRRLMHRATPWPMDQPRVMWHSRIAGDPVSESALTE